MAGKGQVRIIAAAALAVALGLGLAIGFAMWGRERDWYAQGDVAGLPATPENQPIRYGFELVVRTADHIGAYAADPAMRYAGNDLACTNCHLDAGLKPFAAPFVSTFASYPMMVSDVVETLADRLNGCMTRSLNGRPLPVDGREMQALIAYIRYVGRDVPRGVRVAGMGLLPLSDPAEPPDAARGQTVFGEHCAKCHGRDGQGQPQVSSPIDYAIPPLWGPGSFNAAAGMAHIATAAAFIRANMPRGISYSDPILTEQQAWDVAAYVIAQPRPPAPPGDAANSVPPD